MTIKANEPGELRPQSDPLWFVTDASEHGTATGDCVYVRAADEDEAAQAGLDLLMGEVDYDEPPPHVAVIPVAGRVIYTTETAARRSDLQCCGGLPDNDRFGGHTAICPIWKAQASDG